MSTTPSGTLQHLILVRHGETAWSLSGQHTGHSDIPLTPEGRHLAEALKPRLAGYRFAAVLTSPLSRASDTAEIAGFGAVAQRREGLMEWDYGHYEGKTRAEIQEGRPGWDLWKDGVPGGETLARVGERVDAILAETAGFDGDVALFAHGHVLRILTVRFLKLPPGAGADFTLGVASVSVLGWEHGNPVMQLWNDQSHLQPSLTSGPK